MNPLYQISGYQALLKMRCLLTPLEVFLGYHLQHILKCLAIYPLFDNTPMGCLNIHLGVIHSGINNYVSITLCLFTLPQALFAH